MRTLAALLVGLLAALLPACEGAKSDRPSQKKQQPGKLPFPWPPAVGKAYPEITLTDQTGQQTSIASIKGKVVLLEVIGMSCPACSAYAGAHDKQIGRFATVAPQPGLGSIESYAKRFARVSLNDVVYVQLLLYDLSLEAPSHEDGKRWARHFKMDRKQNQIVLTGDARFINPASYKMVPGFHLIDRKGVLRSASSKHHPQENLYTRLLPLMGELVRAGNR